MQIARCRINQCALAAQRHLVRTQIMGRAASEQGEEPANALDLPDLAEDSWCSFTTLSAYSRGWRHSLLRHLAASIGSTEAALGLSFCLKPTNIVGMDFRMSRPASQAVSALGFINLHERCDGLSLMRGETFSSTWQIPAPRFGASAPGRSHQIFIWPRLVQLNCQPPPREGHGSCCSSDRCRCAHPLSRIA